MPGSTSPAYAGRQLPAGDGGRDAEGWQLSITTATGCTSATTASPLTTASARPVTSSFTTTAARSARRDRSTATPSLWELFDLHEDPHELHNIYNSAEAAHCQEALHAELDRLMERYGDTPAS